MAAEPEDAAKAQRQGGIVTPDGKGGFEDKAQMPSCGLCMKPFQQGDTLIDVAYVVEPGQLTVSPGHLACALAILTEKMKRRRAEQQGLTAGADIPPQRVEADKVACEEHSDGCPQGAHPQELVLIEEEGVPPGYFIENLESSMDEMTLKRWRAWYQGQTGAIVQGKCLVYVSDWERFQRGLPVID